MGYIGVTNHFYGIELYKLASIKSRDISYDVFISVTFFIATFCNIAWAAYHFVCDLGSRSLFIYKNSHDICYTLSIKLTISKESRTRPGYKTL